MPVRALDLGRQDLGDVGLVPVAEGVGLADLLDRAALPDGALGGDDEGVVAGVVVLVLDQEPRRWSRSKGASGMRQRADVT